MDHKQGNPGHFNLQVLCFMLLMPTNPIKVVDTLQIKYWYVFWGQIVLFLVCMEKVCHIS